MHKVGPHLRRVASGDACLLYLSVCITLHSNREIPSVPQGAEVKGRVDKGSQVAPAGRDGQFSFRWKYDFSTKVEQSPGLTKSHLSLWSFFSCLMTQTLLINIK